MNAIAVIPARFASTRFPGKPLALIAGWPMVLHVYKRAREIKRVDGVIVATDSDLIVKTVTDAGGVAIFTSQDHQSGTDRVAEITNGMPSDRIVLNIQGDLPFVDPRVCEQLIQCLFDNPNIDIATPVIAQGVGQQRDFLDSNTVKSVFDLNNKALYFSRRPIPDSTPYPVDQFPIWHKHIGIYAYRNEVLQKVSKLKPTKLEQYERLEQLRWLENGINVQCVVVNNDCGPDINCPADLKRLNR